MSNHVAFSASLRLTPSGWAARLTRDTGTPHGWNYTSPERVAAEKWLVNAIGEVLYDAREEDSAA